MSAKPRSSLNVYTFIILIAAAFFAALWIAG